ncbi:hypothetical protein Tco_1369687 [Tanacetum coccineum]
MFPLNSYKNVEQIVPRSQWLTIGKSNLLFNAQKIQKNPIFQISVDILKNTNFFQALTASANVPAIYLQQFWKTMSYNEKTGVYSCQLDEQWFDLSADLLRTALAITPYTDELCVSTLEGNSILAQPVPDRKSWQANMGRVYSRDPDLFLTQSKPQNQSEEPNEESNSSPHPIWTIFKVNILLLGRNKNIHRRPDSAVHYTGDDYVLGNLKFVPKGETVEVFGMAIPDPLITEAIQQSSYYPNYLKMVAANTKKTPRESASVQPATKRTTPKKTTTTIQFKHSKTATLPTKNLPSASFTGKKKGEGEGDDADLERAIKLSLDPALLPQGRAPVGGVTIREPGSEATPKLQEVVGKGKAVVTEEQVAHSLVNLSKKKRTTDQFVFAKRDQSPPPDSDYGSLVQPEEIHQKSGHDRHST